MEELINSAIFESKNYFVIGVIITCFIVGFLLKNYTKLDNNYIPIIMIGVGIISNTLITITDNHSIVTYSTILSGAVSGLASSGFYDMLAKSFGLMKGKESKKEDQS